MARRWLVLMLLVILVLSACGGDDDDDKKETPEVNAQWRLGLVTNIQGTIEDGGFNESAHVGALRAAQELNLDYAYAESLDENDYYIQLDALIAAGRTIIVTVGYPMEAVTLEYAQNHPDVYFVGVDQSYFGTDPIPANLIGLQFTEDEAAFVAGALAGLMTQSNVIAVIGGQEIPPVQKLAQGFRNGAQYVNPAVEVLIEYTGTFSDPDLGTQTAQEFMQQDADVIFGAGGGTGYAGIQYAAREGAWVVGVDMDEWRTNFVNGTLDGADRVLTSAVKRVDVGVYQAVASIVNGDPQSGIFQLNTAGCGVGYAPFHQTDNAIPADVKAKVEAIWRALAAGTLHTGASLTEGDVAPAPLEAGQLPDVPADAPYPNDCDS